MQKSLLLLFTYCFICSFTPKKKILLEKVQIGKFYYSIYKEEKYYYEEDMNATCFEVYGKNNKGSVGGFLSGRHKDTVVIKGYYFCDKNKLVRKTYYFYPRYSSADDSEIATFYPTKGGNLFLKNLKRYKYGKIIEEDKN